MRLSTAEIPAWPKLAWCARLRPGGSTVHVLHGPRVEVQDKWLFEGVWDGEFGAGGFDRTSIAMGSGVRIRGDHVMIVAAGSPVDRLWYGLHEGRWVVANSLPILLACTARTLDDSFRGYQSVASDTVVRPIDVPLPAAPVSAGSVHLLTYHNLRFDGRTLTRIEKPIDAPVFDCFERYRDFMLSTGRSIGANARDAARSHPVTMRGTISSGYDSATSAVVAREAGCDRVMTVRSARSVIPRSDSGENVAEVLGLTCSSYPRSRKTEYEDTLWAAFGRPQDLHFGILNYPEPVCLLFTGVWGGSTWTMKPDKVTVCFDHADTTGLGLCEFRLVRGVIHCPVPTWGGMRGRSIFELTCSPEMRPWILHGEYDRPLPRRLLEEAGVPREDFGQRKSATQFEQTFLWPYARSLQADFLSYLRRHGFGRRSVVIGRLLDHIDRDLILPLQERLRLSTSRRLGESRELGEAIYRWSVDRLRRRYSEALATAGVQARSSIERVRLDAP